LKNISYKVALGGVISALCVVSMLLTAVIPVLYIVIPMIAGILIRITSEEVSLSWASVTYVSVTLLCAIMGFNFDSTLIFALFFGLYPILKTKMDKLKKGLRELAKMAYFFAVAIANYKITVAVIGIDDSIKNMPFSKYWQEIFIGALVFLFMVYDVYLDIFLVFYRKRWRNKFFKGK
jgi:hypothetical protein